MSQLFLVIALLALITWGGKYFYMLYYHRRRKEDINKLEARTAVLRMLLKAKLKRKGSQVQDQYKEEPDFLATIASKLELLTTYNFNRSTDFEDVVGILSAISEALDLHTVQKNPAYYMAQQAHIQEERESILKDGMQAAAKTDAKGDAKSANETQSKQKNEVNTKMPDYDRWAQLLKYDKGNLYIIKEIVDTTEDLKKRVEAYNSEQEKKDLHVRVPDLITINGFDGLKAIISRDREKALATKEENKQRRQQDFHNPDLSDIEPAEAAPAASGDGQNVA